MSRSDGSQEHNVTVHAGDVAAEIFVINSRFERVESGVGRLETHLEPGLYKVKVRTGRDLEEKYLEVVAGAPPQTLTFAPAQFASPAPLAETAKTHEYHTAARDIAQTPPTDVGAGSGGSFFLLARDWSGTHDVRLRSPSLQHPACGLELADERGRRIADLQELSQTNLPDARRDARRRKNERWKIDPWAACHFELASRPYILRLNTPAGRLEQTVVISPGWQTQVYVTQREYIPGEESLFPDLPCASIQMVRVGDGARAEDHTKRLVELARIGLTDGRDVLTDAALGEILDAKLMNPMLGILGAHILLRREKPDLKVLSAILAALRELIGAGTHPDVEALALHLDAKAPYDFSVPPMLSRSWSILLNQTPTRPSLMPVKSLAAQVAHLTWAGEPWLLWMRKGSLAKSRKVYLEGIREQLPQARTQPAIVATPHGLESFHGDDVIARGVHAPGRGPLRFRPLPLAPHPQGRSTPRKPKTQRPQATLKKLVQTTGLPASVVAGLLSEPD